MKCYDPGHDYDVDNYDGNGDERQTLQFMKRIGDNYPGNTYCQPGTNCQELLRVLIDRVKYLDNQISCKENTIILDSLRGALWAFEKRAAERHNLEFNILAENIEEKPYCRKCGHIICEGHT